MCKGRRNRKKKGEKGRGKGGVDERKGVSDGCLALPCVLLWLVVTHHPTCFLLLFIHNHTHLPLLVLCLVLSFSLSLSFSCLCVSVGDGGWAQCFRLFSEFVSECGATSGHHATTTNTRWSWSRLLSSCPSPPALCPFLFLFLFFLLL